MGSGVGSALVWSVWGSGSVGVVFGSGMRLVGQVSYMELVAVGKVSARLRSGRCRVGIGLGFWTLLDRKGWRSFEVLVMVWS